MVPCEFTFTVTGGSSGNEPVGPVTPVVTTTVSFQTVGGTLLPAKQSGATWWADVSFGTDISQLIAVMKKDGVTSKSDVTPFTSGIAKQIEMKTTDSKKMEKIWAGVKLPSGLSIQQAMQQTVKTVQEAYGKGDVVVRPKLDGLTFINPANVYVDSFPDGKYPGTTVTIRDTFTPFITLNGSDLLGFFFVWQEGIPVLTVKKIPADPLVVAAGLTFKIQGTQDGTTVEKPKDLPDALNKLSLNKIFEVDENGNPTSMQDLFDLLSPYIQAGAISYNFFTGELKINVPITVVDGPVPEGLKGVVRPKEGSQYGVAFDPVGGFVIYDGKKDGDIFDPIALMLKKKAPATLSLSPTSMTMLAGETKDVTVTGGSVTWTTADGKIAKIEPTNTPGVYKVTGLAAGTTTMTAKLDSDPTVTAKLTVTVNAVRTSSGSSGCNAGALGLMALALCGAYLWRKQS